MAPFLPLYAPTEDKLPGDSRQDKNSVQNKAYNGKGGSLSKRPANGRLGVNMNSAAGMHTAANFQKARRNKRK